MNGMVRATAMGIAFVLMATTTLAQQAAAPAQPASTPAAPAGATGAAPTTGGPNVATVAETNGRAMLNHESVYAVAKQSQRLQEGDRLVVLENGVVKVQFDTGCMVTIDSPQVYTVPAAAPCAPGATERGLRAAQPTSGTPVAAAGQSDQYLKWGLVALGVATPFIILSSSSAGRPISP